MKNPYSLKLTQVVRAEDLSPEIKLLTLSSGFPRFNPGQFTIITLPGYGEAPFGIMQPFGKNNYLQILVRQVGDLTKKLYQSKKGEKIYFRGPYGNGFPVSEWKKKNITLVAGGTGIVPIKALLDYIEKHKNDFGQIQLLYGAKTPAEILFPEELKQAQKFAEIMLTAEKCPKSWSGNIGLVTCLITLKTILVENTVAVLCGPPIMYKVVIKKLKKLGFEDKDIFLSLERRMRCGVGKCQHCTCGNNYVCLDGPVFRYDETLKFPEGI